MPKPLARRLTVTGSAGRLHYRIAFTGTEPVAHAHSRTLSQPFAADRASNARPRACPLTGPYADPKPRTES